MRAIEKMNGLKEDVEKIDQWKVETKFNNKPVYGEAWFKLEEAINNVAKELFEEYSELKTKIELVSEGIEINHND